MKGCVLFLTLVALGGQPLVDADVLEPSVQNEVDHARNQAPTNAPPITLTGDLFATNGLTKTDIAIKLISAQRADGCWYLGTNNVTRAALDILNSL